jgi:hypothetical protein
MLSSFRSVTLEACSLRLPESQEARQTRVSSGVKSDVNSPLPQAKRLLRSLRIFWAAWTRTALQVSVASHRVPWPTQRRRCDSAQAPDQRRFGGLCDVNLTSTLRRAESPFT